MRKPLLISPVVFRGDYTSMSETISVTTRTQYWQHHVDNFQNSGLSRAQYCRDHELSYHVFKYWLTKLTDDVVPSKLVPVTLSSQANKQSGPGLAIRLPNGVHVSGIDNHSVDLVSRLLAQL